MDCRALVIVLLLSVLKGVGSVSTLERAYLLFFRRHFERQTLRSDEFWCRFYTYIYAGNVFICVRENQMTISKHNGIKCSKALGVPCVPHEIYAHVCAVSVAGEALPSSVPFCSPRTNMSIVLSKVNWPRHNWDVRALLFWGRQMDQTQRRGTDRSNALHHLVSIKCFTWRHHADRRRQLENRRHARALCLCVSASSTCS